MGEDDGSRCARAIKREIERAHEALVCFYRRDFAKAQTVFTTLASFGQGHGQHDPREGLQTPRFDS